MIEGIYSDGKTSKCTDAVLYVTENGRVGLQGAGGEAIAFSSLRISPRIGNTRRYVEFPNGSHFETDDNDAIDALVTRFAPGRLDTFIHSLESSKRLVLATVVVVVLFGWGFIQFGIPHFSQQIAFLLTDEQARMIGEGTLESMDEYILDESELTTERHHELEQAFQQLLDELHLDGIDIVFRNSDSIGANAFALPDGTVLFTDDMVELAEKDEEIIAVMLHEIGHLQYRHSLRRAIQSFSLAIFVAVVTGDVSTSSTIMTGLPAVLVESGYSREMETEADSYALHNMMAQDIDPAWFSLMMSKLQASQTHAYRACMRKTSNKHDCLREAIDRHDTKDGGEEGAMQYFSSHPLTNERIERFRRASEFWKNTQSNAGG